MDLLVQYTYINLLYICGADAHTDAVLGSCCVGVDSLAQTYPMAVRTCLRRRYGMHAVLGSCCVGVDRPQANVTIISYPDSAYLLVHK